MNTQPHENVALSFDELQRISVVEKRLGNLQNEVSLAVKLLAETRVECEKVTKEREYQEGLLETVSEQVIEKQTKATKLDEEILEKVAQLNNLIVEVREHSTKMEAEKLKMKDRENRVESEELKLQEHTKNVLKISADVQKEEELFDAKVAKLKEVIATF